MAAYGMPPDHALIRASFDGNTEEVSQLLAAGEDVSAQNSQGKTALYYASRRGHLDVVGALIDGGASVLASNMFGGTPLHCAARRRATR